MPDNEVVTYDDLIDAAHQALLDEYHFFAAIEDGLESRS